MWLGVHEEQTCFSLALWCIVSLPIDLSYKNEQKKRRQPYHSKTSWKGTWVSTGSQRMMRLTSLPCSLCSVLSPCRNCSPKFLVARFPIVILDAFHITTPHNVVSDWPWGIICKLQSVKLYDKLATVRSSTTFEIQGAAMSIFCEQEDSSALSSIKVGFCILSLNNISELTDSSSHPFWPCPLLFGPNYCFTGFTCLVYLDSLGSSPT